jgi:Protein of unknown function (DUF1549)/Protein of unknown function (DUF1553)/SLA1 homology domain 1, SHD1
MKTSFAVSYLVLACALSAKAETKTTTPPPAEGAVYYTWHDAKGRAVEAAFQGMEGSSIVLQTKDGSIYPIALEKLQASDRELAKKLQSEILAKETNTSADKAVYRIWHDTQGHTVDATFRGVENGNISLQTRDGVVALLPLERLTKEDQEIAKTLKPAGLGIPVDRFVAEAASKIDEIVNLNLKTKGEKPNALASDEQFVRRVYLDLVGRIPTREETVDFLGDTSPSKRAKVIDKLVTSDGFNSRMFDYFSDMLRMADDAQKAKFFSYEEWFKDQLRVNRPWNEIVKDMMTADGKLLENGAAGYLLRDKGMRLDNLSITLSTFLGANVACAQCHDHPFADWTQRQFYEMASFFGTTETYQKKGGGANMLRGMKGELTQQELQRVRKLAQVNALSVYDTGKNDVKLPDDYKYKDAAPKTPVAPKLISWSAKDTDLRSYKEVNASLTKKGGPENLRYDFANWMTSPDNPRFSMTIANRLWKLIFGIGVKEPVTDLDDVNASNNPMLLYHLSKEMVRLKFDIRSFMRLLCNTQAYQREAITKQITPGEPYYFPGPVLRRMTAEQAWDSCVTLAVGDKVDGYKLKRAEQYSAAMDIKAGMTADEIRAKLAMGKGMGKKGPAAAKNGKKGKGPLNQTASEDGDPEHVRPEVMQGLVLARASELPQPEKDQHFLRMFGQSDRQIADANTDEGSIPQVLMLMNGEAQSVLRNPRSLVLATALKQEDQAKKIESLYLSFFSRHPKENEMKDAKEALDGGLSISDLTWVLFNAREFVFVQ